MQKPATKRLLHEILAFSIIYLAIATIFIVSGGNREFLLCLAVLSAIIVTIIGVHSRIEPIT